jgi:hypothetical protein
LLNPSCAARLQIVFKNDQRDEFIVKDGVIPRF